MTPQTRRTLIRFGAGLAFLAILIFLMRLLESVTTIVMIAFFLAYILNPVVQLLNSIGVSRSLGAFLLLFLAFVMAVISLLWLAPALIEEVTAFAKLAPKYVSTLREHVMALADRFNIAIPRNWDQVTDLIVERWRQILPTTANMAAQIFSSAFTSTLKALAMLFYLLLIPIITYYLLDSFDKIKQTVYKLIPSYMRGPVSEKLREIDNVLAGFIRGQLTICLILAGLYSTGFVLVGIDLPIFLGMLSGLLFIIPYLGTMIGIVFGSLMAFAKFGDAIHVGYILGWIAGVQLLEGYVLTPRIVGKAIGLHPVIYILALIVGGDLFGFVGMLVAIPVTAVLKVLMSTLLDAYRNSYLYDEPADKALCEESRDGLS